MKISYEWLSSYFDTEIPKPERISDLLSAHVCEVESVEVVGDDTVLDVKILPDRAPYMLCHRGIAREISVITGIPLSDQKRIPTREETNIDKGTYTIDDGVAIPRAHVVPEVSMYVSRFTARTIDGVQQALTPGWMKKRLETIGQKSINALVDISNYVLFDIGQPTHMFDADQIKGDIVIRFAQEGEEIEVLSGKTYKLTATDLVLADDVGLLDIAGVKGGKRAEISSNTRKTVVVSACFSPSHIRRTSVRLNLRSDASKRFENNIPPERALDALCREAEYIVEAVPQARMSKALDLFNIKTEPQTVVVDALSVAHRIGTDIDTSRMVSILSAMDCVVIQNGSTLEIIPPYDRRDIQHEQDIADEIGRIIGYADLKVCLPEALVSNAPHDPAFVQSEVIKDILVQQGYADVILYALVPKGSHEIVYPLAKDKAALRESLVPLMQQCLITNGRNADVLMQDTIQVFEIGKVFPKTGESLRLALGTLLIKKKKGINAQTIVEDAIAKIGEQFGAPIPKALYVISNGEFGAIAEIMLDEYFKVISPTVSFADIDIAHLVKDVKYKSFSPYPFSTRDIAVFVPESQTEDDVRRVIESLAGPLCVRLWCFDTFAKEVEGERKISYAFRLVFQAMDRTLEESDVEPRINAIYDALKSNQGWIIR